MSEVETQVDERKVILDPIPVERFGIVKNCEHQELERGKRSGTAYLAPVFDTTTKEGRAEMFGWIGEENCAEIVDLQTRRNFQVIYFQCVDDKTGIFNKRLFEDRAKSFTEASMKLAKIEEKIKEQYAKIDALLPYIMDDPTKAPPPEVSAKLKEISEYIKALKQMYENRKRGAKDDGDDD